MTQNHLNRGGEPLVSGGRHGGCTHGGGLKEVTSKGPSSLEILQLQFALRVSLLATGTADRHIAGKATPGG